MWKRKTPLEIKVWLWLIWHNAIATKYNLLKRNLDGDTPFNFAMIVNQFCIFFSHALQLNVFGAWWGLLLVPKLALVPLHNFSGGCHSSLELAEMFRLLAWLRFAGLSGKRVTNGNFFS
jgi:hypothetical protein